MECESTCQDFTRIYHLHLEGNVRQNPKLAGTTYNVFGIQVGVGITLAVRSSRTCRHRICSFSDVDKMLRREEKLAWLGQAYDQLNGVDWQELTPDDRDTWLVPENADEFAKFLPIGQQGSQEIQESCRGDDFQDLLAGRINTIAMSVVYDFAY